ncbi:uncharacterized protein N7469_006786 [Penicillium citrinum]|uniref:Uncharacterized protein n=1 Tax=Penicillium citrinum TaxID=5077 RepID=A0A9W9NVD4_PENCI|nr:uncharacterized protein N7469_006786 [Penicillium citrinum]KAJ5226780.1 hypothetical protein N7469_006786 [Penicillium citrinum]
MALGTKIGGSPHILTGMIRLACIRDWLPETVVKAKELQSPVGCGGDVVRDGPWQSILPHQSMSCINKQGQEREMMMD